MAGCCPGRRRDHLALRQAGTTLVSATENIAETPSGMLLHGIMSSIAEFYSRNLATEVTKGMGQKVKTGGTPSLAPSGYLDVRATFRFDCDPSTVRRALHRSGVEIRSPGSARS